MHDIMQYWQQCQRPVAADADCRQKHCFTCTTSVLIALHCGVAIHLLGCRFGIYASMDALKTSICFSDVISMRWPGCKFRLAIPDSRSMQIYESDCEVQQSILPSFFFTKNRFTTCCSHVRQTTHAAVVNINFDILTTSIQHGCMRSLNYCIRRLFER